MSFLAVCVCVYVCVHACARMSAPVFLIGIVCARDPVCVYACVHMIMCILARFVWKCLLIFVCLYTIDL